MSLGEIFGEGEPLGHSSWFSIIATNSSLQAGFDRMWLVGSLGLLMLTAAATYLMYDIGSSSADHRVATMSFGSLAGLMAARFDVPGPITNSLLHFEMLYYGLTAVALVLAVHILQNAAMWSERVRSRPSQIAAASLTALLVVGDAPAAALMIVLLAVAAAFALVRHPQATASYWAASAVGVAYLIRRLLSASHPRSTWSFSEAFSETTLRESVELLGASIANLTPSIADVGARQTTHQVIGSAALLLMIAAVVVVLLPATRHRIPARLGATNICLSGLIVVSTLGIAANRSLDPATLQLSRFVRSTTFVLIGAVVALLVLLRALLPSGSAALRLSLAMTMLLLRLAAVPDADDQLPFLRQGRLAAIALYCDEAAEPDAWTRYWGPLTDPPVRTYCVNAGSSRPPTRPAMIPLSGHESTGGASLVT